MLITALAKNLALTHSEVMSGSQISYENLVHPFTELSPYIE